MYKKKVEAGILLYALVMVAIFSLVLAFYLNRQLASQRNLVLEREKVSAYALASLSQDEKVTASIGTSSPQPAGARTLVLVDLKTGRSYQFSFSKDQKAEKETTKDPKKDHEEKEREESKPESEKEASVTAVDKKETPTDQVEE